MVPISIKRPAGVLFDLGGTLINSGFDREAGLRGLIDLLPDSDKMNIDRARLVAEELIKAGYSEENDATIQLTRAQFDRNLFARLGVKIDLSDDELDIKFVENMFNVTVEPGAKEMLYELKKMGLRTGLISNSNLGGNCFNHYLAEWGLLDYLDIVMSSSDYGFRKPHPEIFKTALALMETQPEQTWFVGDKPEIDIAGAQAVGIKGIWYNPTATQNSEVEPFFEVRSWMEFINFLNNSH